MSDSNSSEQSANTPSQQPPTSLPISNPMQSAVAAPTQPASANGQKAPSTASRLWNFIIEPKHSNALMAIFTVFIFCTGAMYTGIAYFQWRAMRDTLALAELDARPWIRISEIKLDDSIPLPVISFFKMPTTDVVNVRVEFTVKNIGKGIAQDVFIMPGLNIERWNEASDAKQPEGDHPACTERPEG